MNRISLSALLLIVSISTALSREITLYRTIVDEFSTLEQAQDAVTPESEVVEYQDKFYVVNGLYDKFKDALPEEAKNEEWNKSWKHVLPVKSTVDEARQKGFAIQDTITQEIKKKSSFAAVQADKSLTNVLRSTTARVKDMEARKEKPENELRRDMIQVLEPQLDKFAAIAERAGDPNDAAFAQYWLAKTCYLKGVDLSVQRLPKTSFNHERHAWMEEERCYDSAMEAIDTYLKRFPNSEKAEEVAYLKAATSYHLTYRGHHRHQVELAKQEYQNFIDTYPNSDRVPRAKMNLLGIALELARMDGNNFDEVIKIGESLLADSPGANSYIRSRASIIVAEAYHEGENKDYNVCIEKCDQIIEEFIDSDQRYVIGTAYRLKAYSLYFLKRYNEAIANFTMVIEFWQNPAYHFDYQVEENLAAAYYWRGNAFKKQGLLDAAKTDFQTVLEKHPENQFAKWAQSELDSIEKQAKIQEMLDGDLELFENSKQIIGGE